MHAINELDDFTNLSYILNHVQQMNRLQGMANSNELKLEENKLNDLIEQARELKSLICVRWASPIQCEMGFYILD